MVLFQPSLTTEILLGFHLYLKSYQVMLNFYRVFTITLLINGSMYGDNEDNGMFVLICLRIFYALN